MQKKFLIAAAVLTLGFGSDVATKNSQKNNFRGRMPASVSQPEIDEGTSVLLRRADQTKSDFGEYKKAAMDFKNCYATIGPDAGRFEVYVARTREPVGVVANMRLEQTPGMCPRDFTQQLTEAFKQCN